MLKNNDNTVILKILSVYQVTGFFSMST